jgi:negative regulator of flagellin synthesis FlgM
MRTKLKGVGMKVNGTGIPGTPAAGQVAETRQVDEVAQSAAPSASRGAAGGQLQSTTLQPALAALDQMPDIDQAKVAALRDALARGEMPFNAAKLAALIETHHRSRD